MRCEMASRPSTNTEVRLTCYPGIRAEDRLFKAAKVIITKGLISLKVPEVFPEGLLSLFELILVELTAAVVETT